MLFFATLFIFGDKEVVHDVSRQEAGRNQARARRGACLQCHRGTRPWNLSYPKTLSQPCGPCGLILLFSFAFLEFKSNNHTSSCYATDEQTGLAAKGRENKRNYKKKKIIAAACGKRTRAGQAC